MLSMRVSEVLLRKDGLARVGISRQQTAVSSADQLPAWRSLGVYLVRTLSHSVLSPLSCLDLQALNAGNKRNYK